MDTVKSKTSCTDYYSQKCEQILRDSGAKVTKPRLAVIKLLSTATDCLSPREILEEINLTSRKKSTQVIDQVSVYRILDAFLKLGLVHQVFPTGGYIACTHLNCKAGLHILIHCTECHNTEEIDIPGDIFSPLKWYIEQHKSFVPKNHLFQIDGTCMHCRKHDEIN